MTRDFTCIVCPNGCDLTASYEIDASGTLTVTSVSGNICPKGETYASQELIAPMRTIASSCLVEGGEFPLVSVRLNRTIPKERIFDVMAVIRGTTVKAPVTTGQIIISNVLDLQADVIATKNVSVK